MSALSDAARDYLRLHNKLGHELAEHHGELPRFVAVLDNAVCLRSPSPRRCRNARTRRSITSCIRSESFSPARRRSNQPMPRQSARLGRRRSSRRPAFTSQPTRLKRAKFSTRSAAAATLAAGLVIRMAISRARVTYCGARIRRRSATSDSRVVVEKRRAVPTFSRLT